MPNRLIPILAGASVLALACWLVAAADFSDGTIPGEFWLVLVVLLGALVALQVRLGLRLLGASDAAAHFLRELGQVVPEGALARLREALRVLGASLREYRRNLEAETRALELAQNTLLENEVRYASAVRGADDGMWEWNLRTGSVHYSPRWKSMLGHDEHEVGDSIDEWRGRLHPQDKARVNGEIGAHLQGASPRFESEHRLRHRDGSYRWILARGATSRDAQGRAYRFVGLHTDISARKQIQESLLDVADGLSTLSGDDCFRELTRRFAEALRVREAFVCECTEFPTTRVRMLARWNHGGFDDCVEFDLKGTSCEEVIQTGRPLFVPANIGSRWPLEKTFDRESYLGLPCIDTRGRVIGHIACADPAEMSRELPHLAILKIFSLRAAVELERRILERERLIAPAAANAQH